MFAKFGREEVLLETSNDAIVSIADRAPREVAVEIEMPFGDDANDLPLVALHEMFVTGLSSLYLAQNPAMALTLDLSLK